MDNITLGGREFRPAAVFTIEHRIWSEGVLERANVIGATMEPGEDPDQFARRLWREMRSGPELYNLLAMMLVPAALQDTDWSPAVAKETAEFIRGLTAPEDYQTINDVALAMLTGFFASGTDSLQIFQRLSTTREPVPQNEQTAALLRSGTGRDSSGRSRSTILTKLSAFFAGRSAKRSSRTSSS